MQVVEWRIHDVLQEICINFVLNQPGASSSILDNTLARSNLWTYNTSTLRGRDRECPVSATNWITNYNISYSIHKITEIQFPRILWEKRQTNTTYKNTRNPPACPNFISSILMCILKFEITRKKNVAGEPTKFEQPYCLNWDNCSKPLNLRQYLDQPKHLLCGKSTLFLLLYRLIWFRHGEFIANFYMFISGNFLLRYTPTGHSDHTHETAHLWDSLHPFDTLHHISLCLPKHPMFYLSWRLILVSCSVNTIH